MGLMYIFPIKENELDDHIEVAKATDKSIITLKNYGLPMIFWGYLAAALIVLFFMFLAIKGPLFKMLAGADFTNKVIGIVVLLMFILGPLVLLAFFFYEKKIQKQGSQIKVSHSIFWVPFKSAGHTLKSPTSFIVSHHLSSPNLAKMKQDPTLKGFENKGYFELWMELDNDKSILLDRHTRRVDLTRIAELLGKY